MPDITIKPKGGHLIEVDGKRIFLTDDSDERCEVDLSRNIIANDRGGYDIPTKEGCSSTPAGAEEAMLVAYYMNRPIRAGARRFAVRQVWSE